MNPRPHCLHEICKGCESPSCAEVCFEWQKARDAVICKAEREQFAKGLIEYSNRMGIYNCEEAVGDYLESLRSTQQQAGAP